MNALTRDLMKLTAEVEKRTGFTGAYRQSLHLMPPTGWLNDPNGLCQFQGVYHAFFQYSPFDADGGVKMWGHYTSRNMLDWKYEGVTLYPDQPFDCSGVYSGCAFLEDEIMYLYYTGSVKLEDRDDYDYINSGREANTILVTSHDGRTFGRKKLLMKNEDYPEDLTLHVRDPKVWKEDGIYYMIQGARSREDEGQVILFSSEDKINWNVCGRIKTVERFGYMWECPDYFEIDGQKILSASVQGLTGEKWEDRNVYQSGYFIVTGDIRGDYSLSDYRLWDYGFDYYAPQSFETEDGRRILTAWMGMPDCKEYSNRQNEDGWQHCFTFPREVYIKDGKVLQRPVRELEERKAVLKETESSAKLSGCHVFDAEISDISDNQFHAVIASKLHLRQEDGRFIMEFRDDENGEVSIGRGCRYADTGEVRNVRILADESSVEVFVNDGEYVFSTRYYPDEYTIEICAQNARIRLSEISVSN